MAKQIFLSYRRNDTSGDSGRIYDRLEAAFPGRLFRDREILQPGQDFRVAIDRSLRNTAVLVLVIGPKWLEGRRLDSPDDAVRFELLTAQRYGVTIVPVLLRGASMPKDEQIPPDLRFALRPHALFIHDDDFDHGLERLVVRLEEIAGRRSPRKLHSWGRTLRWIAVAGVLGVSATVMMARWMFEEAKQTLKVVDHFTPVIDTRPAPEPAGGLHFRPAGNWRIQLVGEAPVGGLLRLAHDGAYQLDLFVGDAAIPAAHGHWTYDAPTRTVRMQGAAAANPNERHSMSLRITAASGDDAYHALQDETLKVRLVRR